MVIRARRVFLTAALIVAIAESLNSCSFDDPLVFEFEQHPDVPIKAYIGGELGLIRPAFWRQYLVIAYRYLHDRPLNREEQKQVAEFMPDPRPYNAPEPQIVDAWGDARHRAVPDAPQPARSGGFTYGYMQRTASGFVNCTESAVTTAAATLDKRVSQFGAGSPAVRSWVAAQDLVFGNCDGKGPPPAPAADTLPLIIRKDRDYQIAAAAFYRGDFDDAHGRFLRIAADADSPWASLSRYVAARALVRKATLSVPDEENRSYAELPFVFQAEPMAQAQIEVREILADPRLESIHPAARRLLNFIESRMTPADYLERIGRRLASGKSPSTIGDDLADYRMLRDKDLTSADEMTDWITTFQEGAQRGSFLHAAERWQTTQSVLWLVAAIANADPKDRVTPALLDSAKAVEPSSPAYITAHFHRMRLLRDLHRDAEWQAEIDEVLHHAAKAGPSTRNALLAMRLPLSSSLGQFVHDGERDVVGYESQTVADEPLRYLGDDAVRTVNDWLTLDDLVVMARSSLSPASRRAVLVAAWTRAVLLNRGGVARVIGPELAKAAPEVAAAVKHYLAAPPSDRRNEALLMLIRCPGLTPYAGTADMRNGLRNERLTDDIHTSRHDNWWCRAGQPLYDPRPYAVKPKFVSDKARDEVAAIHKAGSGSTWILRRLTSWARKHPSDPRLPEALSVAIKQAQWACPDDETRAAAATAFAVLHSKYGSTTWAKATPYWYDGKD